MANKTKLINLPPGDGKASPMIHFFRANALLLIGGGLAVVIALSVFVPQLPPKVGCSSEVCKEGREWLATIATLVVILGGLYQYGRTQSWRRAEWVAAETKEFFNDPKVMNALYMLDWNARRLPLLDDAETTRLHFEFRSRLLDTALYSRSTIPQDSTTGKDRVFTEVEKAIRDCFDRMLGGLERFEIFLQRDLVAFEDIQPYLQYWITLIGDKSFGRKPPETIERLWSFIHDYGYSGVQRLCLRFNYDISPVNATPSAAVQ